MIFDGLNRRVILTSANVSATQIWNEYMVWLSNDSNNARWGLAMSQVGGDDLGGGLYIPIYIFLKSGWKVRPMEASHALVITGNLFTEDGSTPLVNTLGNFNVIAQYTVPVQAQAMATSGGAGLTSEEHEAILMSRKILSNSKEIKDNQLTVYDDDNSPLIVWDLKDKNGNATENSVFKSERI